MKNTPLEKIASFQIDHLNHPAGIYLSRRDGDIFTYDIRISSPYKDKKLSPAELHSLEHLLATFLRNGKYKDSLIYVGPMGCQTGFYILFRNIEIAEATGIIVDAFRRTAAFEGEMPGGQKHECGNYRNLSVKKAQNVALRFLKKLEDC